MHCKESILAEVYDTSAKGKKVKNTIGGLWVRASG